MSRRASGTGGVYQLASGRWQGYAVDQDGRKRYVSGPTKRATTTKLEQLQDRLAGGLPARDSTVTVGAYAESWIAGPLADDPTRAPATKSLYAGMLRNHVVPTLGRRPLGELRARDVEQLLAAKSTKLSASTCKQIRAALAAMVKTAIRDGQLARSPLAGVAAAKLQPAEIVAVDGVKVAEILTSAKDDRHYPLWVFLALTGCRRGEAAALTWRAIDLDAGEARISSTRSRIDGQDITGSVKTRRARTVLLPPVLVAALRSWRIRQRAERLAAGDYWTETGLVFTRPDGRGVDVRGVTAQARRLLEANGLTGKNLGPHTFRHSAASILLGDGHAAPVVAEHLGHDVRTLMSTYAHVLDRQRAGVAASLGAIVGG